MKIKSPKTGVAGLASALLFVLVIAACGGSDPEQLEIPVTIVDGEMSPDTIEVKQGDTVTLEVESDKHGDFHLHTYDIEKEVGGAEPVDLIFVADATGRFRITFHATGEQHEEGDEHEGEEEIDLGFLEVRPR
jgi:plastocyanin